MTLQAGECVAFEIQTSFAKGDRFGQECPHCAPERTGHPKGFRLGLKPAFVFSPADV